MSGHRVRLLALLIYGVLVAVTLLPAAELLAVSIEWSFPTKTLATTIAIGTGLALIQAASSKAFGLAWTAFWLWSYLFMGLAPIYQLGTNTFPWLGKFSDATVFTALTVIAVGCIVAYVAGIATTRLKGNRELRLLARGDSSVGMKVGGRLITVALGVYIAVAIGFLSITGTAIFEGKAGFQHQLVANGPLLGSGTLFFVSTAGAIVLPAAAIVARRNRVKVWWPLILVAAMLGFIVTNPLIGSRFLTGSFLIAIAGALLVHTSILRFMPAGIGITLVTVFSSLDLVRGDGTGSTGIALALPRDSLVTFDFDSFEMLLREITVSGRFGGAYPGKFDLLIAPFLRWIPGLSQSVTDHASGPAVAKLTGMGYTNVSMPLWGESHLVGGLLGTIIYFALFGILFGFLRQAASRAHVLAASPTRLLVDSSVAALLFVVLRGSLYEVLGYLLFAVAFGVFIWAVFRIKTSRRLDTYLDLPLRPRTVAFYLPQFHTFPENDEWWGKGFTEWVNVRRALPAFSGHDHPRGVGELEEYDLTTVDVMHTQASLARQYDIDAFCFYFYWFAGKRLMEKPLDQYLSSGPDFPFCISWANENWSRRWDGKDKESLIKQEYTEDSAAEVFDSFLPYLLDKRYLRIDGAAIILVHRADHLPNGVEYSRVWRERAEAANVGPIHIVAAETHPGIQPIPLGFDAVAEFPPVGSNTLAAAQLLPPRGVSPLFRGRLMSYRRLTQWFAQRPVPDFTRYRGVVPGWDNTARRQMQATIYLGNSPDEYRKWLVHARTFESRVRGANGLVFVNAWNEWAEGAYLEPDVTRGRAFLNATMWEPAERVAGHSEVRHGWPSYGWLRSLAFAAAGSALQTIRRTRAALRSFRF